MKDSRFIPLGTAGNGAGDPAGVTVDSEGWIFVALGGVNQLAILSPGGYYERRADVGSRPVAVLVARDEKKSIYVANHLSDSISVIDYTLVSQHNNRATATTSERPAGAYASPRDLYREVDVASQAIPLGPPAKLSAADRGELLFYDAQLVP